MGLDNVRKSLDMYDNAIKYMITLRMSLIPIVADIKKKENLPLFQSKREDEIYSNIEKFAQENGVDVKLVTDIYKLIIANALKIEEEVVNKSEDLNLDISDDNKLQEYFEKLNDILGKDIPEIISKIKNTEELKDLSLTEKSTLYYGKNL